MAVLRRLRGLRLGVAGWVGAAVLAVFVGAALLGPLLSPYPAGERVGIPYAAPSAAHPLGTDDVGRDLLAALLFGAQASLIIGFGVALGSTALGALVGGAAAATRGWRSTVLVRAVDVVLALPFLPLVVVVAAFAGRGLLVQVVMLSALVWARPARIIRAQVLTALERGHVEAAEGMGASRRRVMLRHVSYYVAPLMVPLFVRAAMTAILLEASLAFLGLGDPQRFSWGTTLYWANVRGAVLTDAWLHWVVPPGLAIALVVAALGLVGVRVEEELNPNLATGGPRVVAG